MNYFLINSNQLQLFDVEEAVQKFNLKRDDTVIIVRRSLGLHSKIGIKGEKDLRKFYNWKKVELISPQKTLRMLTIGLSFLKYTLDQKYYSNSVLGIFNNYGEPKNLFFGNYKNEGMLDIANRYEHKANIIFLDEGNTTIKYLKNRNKHLSKKIKDKFLSSNTVKRVFFNIKNNHPKGEVSFFTVYGGESTPHTDVIHNNYENNKVNLINQKEFLDKNIFIGSIMVEFNLIEINVYIELLKSIKDNYGDFIYYAHPKEKDKDLKYYSEELDLEIKRLDEPIELHFISKENVESTILTFQSSAIINLSKIFGNRLNYIVFKIPSYKIINKSYFPELEEIYENFEKCEHISPIELFGAERGLPNN